MPSAVSVTNTLTVVVPLPCRVKPFIPPHTVVAKPTKGAQHSVTQAYIAEVTWNLPVNLARHKENSNQVAQLAVVH